MRKIFISAGHSNRSGRDRGAASGSNIEGVLTVEFRNMLVTELTKMGITPIIDGDNTILSESLTFFRNKTNPNSIVLDIHFNAGPPTATGTETLIPSPNTETELLIAKEISEKVSKVLNIPLRGNHKGVKGVKSELESHHGRLGWMRLTGENVLMEICFISNQNEMITYHNKKQDLAVEISKILYRWSTGVDNINTDIIYEVKSGDSLWKISKDFNVEVSDLIKWNKLTTSTISVGQKITIKK